VRTLIAELHDGEAGNHAFRRFRALARDHRERIAVAHRAQHARGVVFPAEPGFDEVARHLRDRLRVARLGRPDGDGAGRHESHCAMRKCCLSRDEIGKKT
jgi:hypothetical protein